MSKQPKPVVQYHADGVPITNPSVNSLSGVAYFHTKCIDGTAHHVTTARLTEILTDLGVEHPKTEAFDVTLPNGKRIHATIGELAPRPERKPGQHATPPRSAPAEPAPQGEPVKAPAAQRPSGPVVATQVSAGTLPKGMRSDQLEKLAVPAAEHRATTPAPRAKRAPAAKKATTANRSRAAAKAS